MIRLKFLAKTSPKNARGPLLVDGVAKKSLLKKNSLIISFFKDHVTSAKKEKPSSLIFYYNC